MSLLSGERGSGDGQAPIPTASSGPASPCLGLLSRTSASTYGVLRVIEQSSLLGESGSAGTRLGEQTPPLGKLGRGTPSFPGAQVRPLVHGLARRTEIQLWSTLPPPQVPLHSAPSARAHAAVLLARIYHGVSEHAFQIGSQDTKPDSELSTAFCHKADHFSGSLKHWQHTDKVIIQSDFLSDSFKTVPLK